MSSPTLANMVLDGLEARLAAALRKQKRDGKVIFNPMVNLVHYADDFIVTGSSPEVLDQVKTVVADFLRERGLTLSAEKTKTVHIDEGFDFLGQTVRMYDGKLLITPAKTAMKKALEKIRAVVRDNPAISQEVLIGLLNPIIRGWVNYHKHVVAARTFARFDHEVWKALWQWARRRHRKKGARWVRKRYFRTVGTRTWTFACEVMTKGKPKTVKLAYATDTAIRRHTKVRAAANPYDPAWEPYFEARLTRQMKDRFEGSTKLWRLWSRQDGRCPECGDPITPDTGWHVHHVVYRVHGGASVMSNLQLLHPNCHRKLHHGSRALPGSP